MLERRAGEEGVIPDQAAVTHGEGDGIAPNPAGELAGSDFIPAERLAAKQGGGEIEWNGELQGGHGGEKLKG